MRRTVGSLAALLAGLVACTAAPPASGPTPPATSSAASTPAPGSATPAATPSAAPSPALTVPLVFAVHATRPLADVSLAEARRVVAEGADRWSDLGQSGGRVRVLTATPTRTADRVLAEVRGADDVVGVVPAPAVDARVRVLTVGGRHPLRTPQAYTLRTPGTDKAPVVTTLTVVGDVMLGRRVGRAMARADDPVDPLGPLADRLAGADITVGNVESTLSRAGSPTQGGDSFAADPGVTDDLRRAGFDVVSLANNHVGDYGPRALRQTLDRFAAAKLPTVGAGRDLDQARAPVIVRRDGVSVGFIATESIGETPAATAGRPGTNRLDMPPRTGPLDEAALRRITSDIARLAQRVDTVVVLPHWGTQYTHVPEASQRRAARAFAQAGADLIVGGHPHWVQGWERFGSATVVHSLGNFVFDMDFQTKTREGVFVEAVLWDGEVKAVEPVPYVIDADFTPRRVSGERARGILADVWSTSRGAYARP